MSSIGAVVREAPEVRLLLTSRERVRLRDEHLVELGGLRLPGERSVDIERSDAVLLFLERARQKMAKAQALLRETRNREP